jgi:DNA-binding transcriptional MerR regulator
MMADEPDEAWTGEGRRGGKSAEAFRTISEVSSALEVPQHVLRFWETKFVQVRPLKRAGGRRYYRPEDVTLLRSIRDLLYRDGYTIKGAQKLLREGGLKQVPSARVEGAGLANRRSVPGAAALPRQAATPARGTAAAPQPSRNAPQAGGTPAPAASSERAGAKGSDEEFTVTRSELEALVDELTTLRELLRNKLR